MSGENDYIRPERKYLCDFSVDTRIDDIALPEKICENLLSLNLSISSDMRYSLEVSFGADIYKDKDFYRFPVERKQWQIEKLRSLSPQKMAEQMIDDILSQQLDNICKALSPFHIWYTSFVFVSVDRPETILTKEVSLFLSFLFSPALPVVFSCLSAQKTEPLIFKGSIHFGIIPTQSWQQASG